jgi:quinol monooxygenase YgiN
MEFTPEGTVAFLENFDRVKDKIRAQEGCVHLELLRDIHHSHTLFTRSLWKGPEYLERYRKSDLFQETWAFTKSLFASPAQAWSVETIRELP